jgi:hypothetical protein
MAPHRFERRSLQRILVVAATWIAVTAGATALGWRSVTFVTAQVTDQPSRPVNGTSSGPESIMPAPPLNEATSSTAETRTSTTPTSAPSTPGDSTPPAGTSVPGSVPAPHGPTATPTTAGRDEDRNRTPPSSAASSTQTISAVGGVTTVACNSNQIQLLSASPNPGYAVSVNGGDRQPNTQQLEVQYQATNHQSDVTASCVSGRPMYTVNESRAD